MIQHLRCAPDIGQRENPQASHAFVPHEGGLINGYRTLALAAAQRYVHLLTGIDQTDPFRLPITATSYLG